MNDLETVRLKGLLSRLDQLQHHLETVGLKSLHSQLSQIQRRAEALEDLRRRSFLLRLSQLQRQAETLVQTIKATENTVDLVTFDLIQFGLTEDEAKGWISYLPDYKRRPRHP
jgi:hypothetical protein